jgi:hypothetical protein
MTAERQAQAVSQILEVLTAAAIAAALIASDERESAEAWLQISRVAANKLKLMAGTN